MLLRAFQVFFVLISVKLNMVAELFLNEGISFHWKVIFSCLSNRLIIIRTVSPVERGPDQWVGMRLSERAGWDGAKGDTGMDKGSWFT